MESHAPPMSACKTYLYQLQLQAPKPIARLCMRNLSDRPAHFGREFHGMISRQHAESLLTVEDGSFLVRSSNHPPSSCTLAIKFNNETKNYKVFYDSAFYVGEKRFDTIADLVHDGLISFYIEKHAASYVALMCDESNYSESPYYLARQRIQQSGSGVESSQSSRHSMPPKSAGALHRQQQQQQHQRQQSTVNSVELIEWPLSFSISRHHAPNDAALYPHRRSDSSASGNSNSSQLRLLNALDFRNAVQLANASAVSLSSSSNISASRMPNAILDRFSIMNSEKAHRFKPQSFSGPHWCDFCLNFMWGLVAQGCKCQDCGFQAHRKCSERTPPDCEPRMKCIKRMFGVDLTTLVKATNTIRPLVVERCVEEIECRQGALDTQGLYRVSALSAEVDELRSALDRGELIHLDHFRYADIHVVCNLLKLYLRQLPIPLFTFDVYSRLIELTNLIGSSGGATRTLDAVRSCIVDLPPAHYLTAKYLLQHLAKVARHSHTNQMNIENLSIVFAPTLMRPLSSCAGSGTLQSIHKEQRIVELLIDNCELVFDR